MTRALVGGLLVGAVLTAALLSLVWTPHPITDLAIGERLRPASADHWLGTDPLGRDIASLLLAGAQTTVAVGVVAVGIGLIGGIVLGTLAATRGGFVDEGISRFCDVILAFPAVISALLATILLGPGAVNAILAIGLFNVPVFARLTRACVRQVRVRDYVRAAQALGKSSFSIAWDHLLPNVAGVLVVQATIQFGIAILAEAGLSYLGIGAQPPQPSWGRMLNESQTYMFSAPWLALYPGLAISLAVLGCNLLGDSLRDALDPKTRAMVGARHASG